MELTPVFEEPQSELDEFDELLFIFIQSPSTSVYPANSARNPFTISLPAKVLPQLYIAAAKAGCKVEQGMNVPKGASAKLSELTYSALENEFADFLDSLGCITISTNAIRAGSFRLELISNLVIWNYYQPYKLPEIDLLHSAFKYFFPNFLHEVDTAHGLPHDKQHSICLEMTRRFVNCMNIMQMDSKGDIEARLQREGYLQHRSAVPQSYSRMAITILAKKWSYHEHDIYPIMRKIVVPNLRYFEFLEPCTM